jgi:hypothetical protein
MVGLAEGLYLVTAGLCPLLAALFLRTAGLLTLEAFTAALAGAGFVAAASFAVPERLRMGAFEALGGVICCDVSAEVGYEVRRGLPIG